MDATSHPKLYASQISPEERSDLGKRLLDWRAAKRALELKGSWNNTQTFLPGHTLTRILGDSHLLVSLEFFRARYNTWCFFDESHPAEIFNIVDVWRNAVIKRNEAKVETVAVSKE